MRLLILGGTGFIGPHQVRYALARGHRVTVFNRGRQKETWPGPVEELFGDRDGDLKALEGRDWDVCIDNRTTLPIWVRDAARVLKGHVGQYVFISTISMGAILETATLLLFGPSPRVGPPILTNGSLQLGAAVLNVQALSMIVLAVALVAAQYWILSKTVLGKRLRAVAEDREMATALGMNVNVMIFITFGIAASLAGAAGLMFANTFYITPGDGEAYMIKTYVAATMGGWGSLRGAVVGAFIVAAFEVLVPSLPVILPGLIGAIPSFDALFSPTASTIWLYLAFLVVLFFRPQGLFGEAVQQRA